jgi:hypothetical protein
MGRKQKYEKKLLGKVYVRHNGKLCPWFPRREWVDIPPPFPTKHPAWPAFVAFVESGKVVRRDLLSAERRADVDIIWGTFLAGVAEAQCGRGTNPQQG